MIYDHQNAVENKNIEDLPKNPFTKDQLLNSWKKFAFGLKKQGKESFYAMLVNNEPELRGEFEVHFMITNNIQKESLERIKSDLLKHIRKELNNWSISFSYEVNEDQDENKENLYSSKDRFKKMTEKNASLLKMQKLFNLDIEF